MNSAKKLRKRIYVDRHVQGGIVLRLMCLWIVSTALAIAVAVVMQFFANPTVGFSQFMSNVTQLLLPLAMALAATLPIAVLHLLRFTHRFAGPVVRLRRVMQELAAGQDVEPIKFRDGDYWQELADEFNVIAASLGDEKTKVAELRAQLSELQVAADTYQTTDQDAPFAAI